LFTYIQDVIKQGHPIVYKFEKVNIQKKY